MSGLDETEEKRRREPNGASPTEMPSRKQPDHEDQHEKHDPTSFPHTRLSASIADRPRLARHYAGHPRAGSPAPHPYSWHGLPARSYTHAIFSTSSGTQPVDPIERGGLVALGQCGIVEDRVDEVVDRAAECQDGLADVDQFAGALADDMDA